MRNNHRVRAMVLYNSFNSWGWLEALPPDVMGSVDVHVGDVRDIASVREFAENADVLFHLAALIAIPYSYSSPRSYAETNVLGTLNVLEAARQLSIPRIVHTSTSEVYGTARTVPINEEHPLQAQSPYSATKIGADKLAESYGRSFGLPIVTIRPFNVFGPRQSARAVIPTILSQLSAGVDVLRIGDLRPTRDFTFVEDTVAAFMALADASGEAVIGRTFNAGTGSEISIGGLANLLCEITGRSPEIREDEARLRPPESEVMRLVADSTAIRAATGWVPRHRLEDGLRLTAGWFARPENLARYKWEHYNR